MLLTFMTIHFFQFPVEHGVPMELDEKVAKFHIPALTVPLNVFTHKRADYTGVKVEDP